MLNSVACMYFFFVIFYSGFLRRLAIFRSQNEDDITVLNYFDEFEIHPDHIGMLAILIMMACPYVHSLYIGRE